MQRVLALLFFLIHDPAFVESSDLDKALLFGEWRTTEEMASMTEDDKRNTLIGALAVQSSLSISHLQALGNSGNLGSLTGFAAISGQTF